MFTSNWSGKACKEPAKREQQKKVCEREREEKKQET